jgi:DNA-binding LytR/AlgR family response regulator
MNTKKSIQEKNGGNLRAYYAELQAKYVLDIPEEHKVTRVILINILYMECDSYLTTVHLTNGKEVVSSYHLKKYEQKVAGTGFIRINHNILVNSVHIDEVEYLPNNKCSVSVKEELLAVSKRKRKVLNSYFSTSHLLDKSAHLLDENTHLLDENAHL